MLSTELQDSEKLDRLHALIPADVFRIDNLNKATPDQLRRLKEAMAVSEALQEIRRPNYFSKKTGRNQIATAKEYHDPRLRLRNLTPVSQ